MRTSTIGGAWVRPDTTSETTIASRTPLETVRITLSNLHRKLHRSPQLHVAGKIGHPAKPAAAKRAAGKIGAWAVAAIHDDRLVDEFGKHEGLRRHTPERNVDRAGNVAFHKFAPSAHVENQRWCPRPDLIVQRQCREILHDTTKRRAFISKRGSVPASATSTAMVSPRASRRAADTRPATSSVAPFWSSISSASDRSAPAVVTVARYSTIFSNRRRTSSTAEG